MSSSSALHSVAIVSRIQAAVLDIGLFRTSICVVGIWLLWQLGHVVYGLYFGPLSKIPGPRIAAATNLWLLRRLYQYRKNRTINDCFEEYGPIVRIGPNKVALNTEQDIKTVYAIGTKFVKSSWYLTWSLMGYDNVFTFINPKQHADRRRITAKLMAKNSVILYLDDISQHIRDFIRLCNKSAAQGQAINFMHLYRYMALDVLGSAALGKSFDLMKTGQSHPFVHDLDACVMAIPPRGYLPSWLWWFIKRIPNKQWQFELGGEQRIFNYSSDIIEEKIQRASKNGGKLSERDANTIVGRYIEHRDDDGKPLPRGEINAELGNIYFAGTDTTSNTLSFLSWELATKPEIQARLFAELKEKMPNHGAVPALEDVETWPFLNAVINETLRKYAAAPSQLERVVPPGGAVLHGYYLPEGTIVGVQAFSIHRKKEVFPDPETFNPDRWLNATDEMRRHFMPFGLGSRICLGMHIAMLEMRLVLACLVRQFELQPLPTQDPRAMEMKDFWLAFPAGKTLELMAIPRME